MPEHKPPGQADRVPPSVAFLLSRLGYEVRAHFTARLRPLGIEPREFGLLRLLARNDGGSQRALGEILDISPNRMVAVVDGLEAKGLVERRAHPTDRRAHSLGLTAAGTDVLARAFGVVFSLETAVCEPLDAAERVHLLRLLGKLAASAGGMVGVHPGLTDPGAPHADTRSVPPLPPGQPPGCPAHNQPQTEPSPTSG